MCSAVFLRDARLLKLYVENADVTFMLADATWLKLHNLGTCACYILYSLWVRSLVHTCRTPPRAVWSSLWARQILRASQPIERALLYVAR